MLHTNAVQPGTWTLLNEIMDLQMLSHFNLAGGTALALQLGHRISYDLDFFGTGDVALEEIKATIDAQHDATEMHRTEHILVLDIEGIKVDFVKYAYPLIEEPLKDKGLRLLSCKDIAAMKLDSIKGRGRKRDFFDIYFLLKIFDLPEMMRFHFEKYQEDTSFLILKSLVYFEDAENDPPVNLLVEGTNWETVKDTIKHQVNTFY